MHHLRSKLHTSLLLLTFLALYLPVINAVGTLTPTGANPIDASIANRDEVADYTFYFIPDTIIPAGGALYVRFPTQYVFGLGIAVDPVCSVTCTISGFEAIFFFDSPVLNNVATSVTIKSVANPTQKGGTGSFQLISRTGDNILDQNLVFGVIGIADTVGLLTSTLVSLDSTGVLNAGEVTKYAFSFKVSQPIPAGSYMKFVFNDKNFGLSKYPSCNAFSINGKIISGKLTCETVGREVYVRGVSADIPAAQDVGITVSVTNPPFSGMTSTFFIAIFRDGTNAIYDRRIDIAGIPITAGKFSNVNLVKVDTDSLQARNKIMDYTLTFLPKNALKSGSVITLTFPNTFKLDTSADANNYVRYGLDDISEDVRVDMKITLAGTLITLGIFQPMDIPQEISLQLRLINPDNIGTTTPIYIRTYTDSTLTTLIDEDTTNAVTSIRNLPSPTAHTVAPSPVATSLSLASLTFTMTPSISVLGSGVIKIKVPDGFTVGTVLNSNCFVQSVNTGSVFVAAGTCRNIDNLITLTLPSTASFPLGTSCSFRLDNVIKTPVYNGTLLFDITTYKSDGTTAIESWTDAMVATSVPFPSSNTKSLCIGRGLTTILTVTFTTGLAVPAGITQTKATDTKGFIELEFTGITSAQLGATSTAKQTIPCRANSGLSAISDKIKCIIIPGITAPLIRVENFKAVPAGTIVSVSFPKILNPSAGASFAIYTKTISRYNRIRTQLNAVSMTVAIAAPVALTDNGAVPTSGYVFTSNKVSTFTNITFTPGTSTTINGPGTFIIEFPSYDIGWIPHSNTIGCKLDTQFFPCTRYDGADWITIDLPAGVSFPTSKTIKLENIQVPRYTNPAVTGPLLRYIMSNNHERVNRPQQFFPAATVPQFYSAQLIVNKKSKGAVNAEYTFVFAPTYEIPDGAVVVITFPNEYNLLSSYPPVAFSSPDLVDLSSTSKVTFIPDVQTLTITNFKAHPAKTAFTIVVQGLRNPSILATSTGWRCEVKISSQNQISHTNFDQFVFTPALSPGTITFNSIRAFPLNAGELADYTISFVPATEIPAGGEIRLTFPEADFTTLPSPPDCRVSEGITTFSRCTLSGNTYTIELDQEYTTGGISIMIRNVINPDQGITDGFIVRTYYDGTFLDNTDTSDFNGRTVSIVAPGALMTIKSLAINPRNEGESATYTFSFLPTNTIKTTMEIQFRFPDVYDLNLGSSIKCSATSGLDGDVSCAVSDRVVTASGFDEYVPDADNPITLNIFGVVNPNQNINSDTGYIRVATLETNTEVFIDYNSDAGVFEPYPAPGWSPLFNISATNLYTRLNANYTFNFTTYAGIPSTSSQGAIFIDFPSEFVLATKSYGCESKTSAFASTLNCKSDSDRNRVTINGQTALYTGNVIFKVAAILNPVEEGTAGNIVLKTYDGFNKQIIERSYKNLDPFTFAYKYPGPQITVNNNNPIRVERGTQTQDLYITLDYPCALNLTFKASTAGFSVLPYNLKLSLGEISSTFRISVPQSFAEGTYYIEWTTLNEQDPPFYTPLKKTTVIVTRLTNLRIEVPALYEIPFGGNSLPSYFTAEYGPDIGIEVTMAFKEDYVGIQLDRKNVIFRAGSEKSAFVIYSSNDTAVTGGVKIDRGTLSLSVAGLNKDVYALSENTIDFLVVDADPVQPDITELTVTDITKNSATLIIGTSEICVAYYMIALAGTPTPGVDEVINQGPPSYETTQSKYGMVQIGKENRVSISLTGLVAETPYQIYVFVYDRGGNTNDPRTETFSTLNRYNSADFQLKFKQSFLNSAERANIITTVAFVLSLYPSKVQQKKYDIIATSSSRLLQEEIPETQNPLVLVTNTTESPCIDSTNEDLYTDFTPKNSTYMLLEEESITIDLQIIATPESSVYLSPKNLALLLNDRNDMLASRLTNFDSSFVITATEFTRYIPAFPATPANSATGTYWATITSSLNNYGYVFAVFLEASEDFGKPSPYQILHGFNSKNVKNPSGSMEISETYEDFTMNVTGLEASTDYNVYIVAGSAHPGYPDLMATDSIVMLPIRTLPPTTIPHLNIDDASVLQVTYIVLIISMLFAVII